MCRWLAYTGGEIPLSELTSLPAHRAPARWLQADFAETVVRGPSAPPASAPDAPRPPPTRSDRLIHRHRPGPTDLLPPIRHASQESIVLSVIVAEFVHDEAADYQLMFKSDDDAWVFLDGQMIADLGGINGSAEQWVDLERLSVVDGETYQIHFYKADRSDESSRFHLVTNIPLTTAYVPTLLASWD